MGEAKWRKLNDPHFGMRPKKGRGIVLSAPVSWDGSQLSVRNDIDPASLRRSALFWDRLVWPDSKIISIESNRDERVLEEEGILLRPNLNKYSKLLGWGDSGTLMKLSEGSSAKIASGFGRHFIDEHIEKYIELDTEEPGQWVLSEGEESLYLKNQNFVPNRGQIVSLYKAVPLPSPDFPIAELLEFKLKRESEVVALNHKLDEFYSFIHRSSDKHSELIRLLEVIDKNCLDMIKVSRESKYKFYWGDLNVSLSVNNLESAITRGFTWELFLQTTFGLPLVGAVTGGASSFVSLDRGLGVRNLGSRESPFKVVASMHKELV